MMNSFANLIFRPVQERDRPQFINLARLAFTPQTPLAEVEQTLLEHPLNPPGRQGWVVEDDTGNLVARYRHLAFNTYLEGVNFPIAGIGGVAVAMERRGQGLARWMLEQALQEFRAQQIPLSMLYPFQHGFYRQLGWASVGQHRQFRVATRHFPSYPERCHIQAYSAPQAAALQALYAQVAAQQNGWLQRDTWQWEAFFKIQGGRELYTYVEAGELLGYGVLEFKRPDWSQGQWVVIVQEWVAQTAAAYRGLVSFVGSLRDQVAIAVWNTHQHDPLPHLLREQQAAPPRPVAETEFGYTHQFGAIGGGFMWRLVDWQTALALRPIQPCPAFCLTLAVHDPVFGTESATVDCVEGRMRLGQAPASTTVNISLEHLTALFAGERSPLELHWTGELEIEGDESLLNTLAIAWKATPPFCWDFF